VPELAEDRVDRVAALVEQVESVSRGQELLSARPLPVLEALLEGADKRAWGVAVGAHRSCPADLGEGAGQGKIVAVLISSFANQGGPPGPGFSAISAISAASAAQGGAANALS